jgi:hypothetical protein
LIQTFDEIENRYQAQDHNYQQHQPRQDNRSLTFRFLFHCGLIAHGTLEWLMVEQVLVVLSGLAKKKL